MKVSLKIILKRASQVKQEHSQNLRRVNRAYDFLLQHRTGYGAFGGMKSIPYDLARRDAAALLNFDLQKKALRTIFVQKIPYTCTHFKDETE